MVLIIIAHVYAKWKEIPNCVQLFFWRHPCCSL